MSTHAADRWRAFAVCVALLLVPTVALAACAGKTSGDPFDCTNDVEHPKALACTGLYSDWSSKMLATEAVAYTPLFAAWSDGLDKARYIALPAGATIDKTNPNEWRFPIGTRLWKEFSRAGKRIETRFAQKRDDGTWLRTTYRWSPDGQTSALELTEGERDVEGTGYEIPPRAACATCHDGREDGVLGYDAIALSAPGEVVQGDPVAAEALGWLHANCGTACHSESPHALARATKLNLRLDARAPSAPAESTNACKTAVNVPSSFIPSESPARLRIKPGSARESVIVFRASYRGPDESAQMPPIASHAIDPIGVEHLRAWIDTLSPSAP